MFLPEYKQFVELGPPAPPPTKVVLSAETVRAAGVGVSAMTWGLMYRGGYRFPISTGLMPV